MPVAERFRTIEELELDLPLAPEEPEPRDTFATLAKSWLKTMAITASIFFLINQFAVQGFAVSGSCMEPNLRTGERVLGNKLVYRLSTPSRGDVVVFRYPVDPTKTYIKRVIGLPGEIIEIRSGKVFIDGRHLNEPYVINVPHGDYGPERVKPGNLFVMGDYRDESNDSRIWGELPILNVKAKAWVKYWPFQRAEMM